MRGTLYVVATPIGNLEDVTLRAVDTLKRVALIACEDTRRTRKLLDRHGIEARCVSCHKFNEPRAARRILAELAGGRDVALVSDGGTPAISDPGHLLVSRAVEAGFTVRPVPGPSVVVAALSASGLSGDEFTFRGFLPHREGERRRMLRRIAGETPIQVFFESPVRIAASLGDMAAVLGERRCCVVREMTKRFEQWYRGTLHEVAEAIGTSPARGEFCVLVEGFAGRARGEERGPGPCSAEGAVLVDAERLSAEYDVLLTSGLDRRAALRRLAREHGLSRSETYRLLAEARGGQGRSEPGAPEEPPE